MEKNIEMKKYIVIGFLLACNALYAKKVKFAVNMINETVNTTGVHVYGSFQVAAGYQYDWDPGTIAMTQETGDTNVYSVVLDIPAFQVYEYRFINGNQSYEVEFVPEESRVNGAFDDNRWMYVDSAADDTAFIGVIPYSTNSPDGLSLVVFKVNMILQNISPAGVHIGGDFQGWDPAKSKMITFNDTVYLYQAFLPVGTYHFKYVNGNTGSDFEYVPSPCASGGNREVIVSDDVALEPVNFASCLVGISENEFADGIDLYPNPANGSCRINFNDNSSMHNVLVSDVTGRHVNSYSCSTRSLVLENLDAGIYMVSIRNNEKQEANVRLVIQ